MAPGQGPRAQRGEFLSAAGGKPILKSKEVWVALLAIILGWAGEQGLPAPPLEAVESVAVYILLALRILSTGAPIDYKRLI